MSSGVTPSQCNILLVDDHADTLKVLAKLLEGLGHRVTVACDVADAVGRAAGRGMDLLICDFGLPDGTGVDVLRHLQTTSPDIPAIVLTGYDHEDDVKTCLAAGFRMHLTKPVELSALKAAVEKLIDRAR
jgi:CheY-like chemotaxis protein